MVDDVIDECFGRDALDFDLLVVSADVMPNGMEKMGFPEADSSMDKKGVV